MTRSAVPDALRGRARLLALNVIVGLAYYGAARLSLRVALVGSTVTPVWPPTGLALVAFLVFGRPAWGGIAVAAFFANLGAQGPGVAALIAIGNTAAPLVAFLALRRAGFRRGMDRLRDAFALIFLGGLVPMTVSATVGTSTLAFVGTLPARDYLSTWSVWWTGDALGVLVFTPFLLVLPTIGRGLSWRARVEGLIVLAGTGLVSGLIVHNRLPLLFLMFPLVVYAAMRFFQAGAACSVAVISIIAVSGAVGGVGPFAGRTLFGKMLTLQAFNGSLALTAFLLAALMTERARARASVEHLRRRQALELNDEIIQGLSVASYALELDDAPTAARAVARTLTSARAIVAELLDAHRLNEVGSAGLRRERAAEIGVVGEPPR